MPEEKTRRLLVNRPDFNHEFPETFDWLSLDGIVAAELGLSLSAMIRIECREPVEKRIYVPGMRKALVTLAMRVDERGITSADRR